MIPGEIRNKISLKMTAAHCFSYLNEVSTHFRCAHLVKAHYLTSFCLSDSLFFFPSLADQNTNLFSYCSLASFYLFSLLFSLTSCSHSVPSGCMNNTCCHACVFLCAWSHPPVRLGAVLKWLVSHFLWCLPSFWACEYLHRTYTTLPSIPQPYPLAIPAPSHKNDAIELN